MIIATATILSGLKNRQVSIPYFLDHMGRLYSYANNRLSYSITNDSIGYGLSVMICSSYLLFLHLFAQSLVIVAVVAKTAVTPVPSSFQVVKLRLDDGRTVAASWSHPTSDERVLGDYKMGDVLDGALVATVEYVPYNSGATYDLLPSGSTGLYWANGILLKSTLTTN